MPAQGRRIAFPLVHPAIWLLLLILLSARAAATTDFQTVNFVLQWQGGVASPNCTCNNDSSSPFACSSGNGDWNGGVLSFMDPLAGSNKPYLPVALELVVSGFFNCNNMTDPAQVLVLLQSSTIGSGIFQLPMDPMGCACPNCASTAARVRLAQSWPFGMNHYKRQDTNSSVFTSVCLTSFNVTMTFADVQYGSWIVVQLVPDLGVVTGGTLVQVFGSGFPLTDLSCNFGNVAVDVLPDGDESYCSCIAPPSNDTGYTGFRLRQGDLVSREEYPFLYYDTPTVTSMFPVSGPAIGGTEITIQGTGFVNTSYIQCGFGLYGHGKDPTFVSPTLMTCISPSLPVARARQATRSLFSVLASEDDDDDGSSEANVTVTISFDTQTYFGNLTFSYYAPPANTTTTPWETYLVWTGTGVALLAIAMIIGVLLARTYCGCGVADYEVIRDKAEDGLWAHADFKQINPSEIVLGERIGKGSFGQVFRGTWRGTQVAVKKLHMPMLVDDAFVKEFKNEIDVMRRVSHPNCLQFLGASLIPPDIVIVTEFMSRGSLYKILHSSNIPIDWSLRRNIVLDTCRGMCYLHGSNPVIIHRDLKSHNLLLDDNWRTKVCDFGLSKVVLETGSAAQLTACGTPCWTAPEVIKNQMYTTKADVYSFGIVLWELVTREDPFKGMPPFQVVFAVGTKGLRPPVPEDCPPFWADLMRRCWSENPDDRPSFDTILDRVESMPDAY